MFAKTKACIKVAVPLIVLPDIPPVKVMFPLGLLSILFILNCPSVNETKAKADNVKSTVITLLKATFL